MKRITPSMVVSITALVFSTTGSAFAAKTLIDGGDIKNGSITAADIKDGSLSSREMAEGSISLDRLSDGTQRRINEKPHAGKDGTNGVNGKDGANGRDGANGKDGANGQDGTTGAAGTTAASDSGNWGVVNRNTIGSPDIFLRSGPAIPPKGTGSLGFSVGSPAEKAAYGNEKDFAGQPVSGLDQVGFSVYTTGEDAAKGSPNMPSIAFEIDPNLTATPSNFSTLVFVPNNTAPNAWTSIDATNPATGFWFLTGAAGTATNCNQTTTCTFAEVKAALAQGTGATIVTAQITKGRDFEWQGAVDALRINAKVYDFESSGVNVRAA
jgi:hypothetical protein